PGTSGPSRRAHQADLYASTEQRDPRGAQSAGSLTGPNYSRLPSLPLLSPRPSTVMRYFFGESGKYNPPSRFGSTFAIQLRSKVNAVSSRLDPFPLTPSA